VIGIMLLTYDRLEYARRTLIGAARHLRAEEPFWLHIADDGSSQEYRDDLFDLGHEHFGDNVSISNSDRSGYGASYNLGTQLLHSVSDLILPLEDDWELCTDLDLTPVASVLRSGLFGCVRLGYIGFTQELRATFVSSAGLLWLALDPDSPEPHVFAGGPRLETVEFERVVGPWPEGQPAGVTEFIVAHRPESRVGVAWPVDLIHPRGDAFLHIGEVPVKDAALKVPA